MRIEEIRSTKKLCSLLHISKEYLFDLVSRVQSCYHSYEKPIRRGGKVVKTRHIDSPNLELKTIQKRINKNILQPNMERLPDYIHGARPTRNIMTNAANHINKQAVLLIDIKNCFPNIEAKRVYYVYRNAFHCSDNIATILTKLTTKDGYLPQGCPTSAALCNFVLLHLLEEIDQVCKNYNLQMSQYVDDICISGELSSLSEVTSIVLDKIGKAGLRPNRRKTRIVYKNKQMRVTGVVVNMKASAGRKRIRKIERTIIKLSPHSKARIQQSSASSRHDVSDKQLNRLCGEISNVVSINKQQGARLVNVLKKKGYG